MIAAVADVDQIDRQQRRAAAERRFSPTRLAVGYDRPCHDIPERPRQLTPTRGAR